MRNFKIEIECDNDAFQGNSHEVERILKDIIGKIKNGYKEGKIFDINGNKTGTWGFIKK